MYRTTLTRREFVRWSAILAGATALAACAPPAQPPAAPTSAPAGATAAPAGATQVPAATAAAQEAQVRYAMWDWYAMAPGVRWDEWNQKEAFPAFQKDHPGVTLSWEPLGEGWEQKVLTQMAAATAPDIISVWSPSMEIWAEKGQLLDLQPYIDKDIPNADSIYMKFAWEQMWSPFFKIRMGMLADVDITSVYYNKTAFQEAGVPLPTKDWNTDDYTAAAEKLVKKDSGGQITRWGGDYREDFWTGYGHYVKAFGGKVRDDETQIKCLLGEPDALAGLEWIRKNMWERNCFVQPNQMTATGIPNTWTGVLPAGVVAFAERSADQFFALAEGCKDFEWDIAHVPQGPKGREGMGLPDQWVVYKGVLQRGNADAVWEVMKWLTGEWYQEKIASVAGRIPGRLSQVEGWANTLRKLDPRLEKVRLETLQEQISMGYPRGTDMFRYQAVADEQLTPAIQQIFVEGKAGVEIMKEVADKINQAEQEAAARAGS